MEYPRASIIILNWNGLKDTIKCLESLKKITYPNYEAIVVDNGSKRKEADILEEKYKGYVRLIKNKENLGFAGGNNVAIREVLKEGKSDYLMLLNNDTVVAPDFLTELVKVIEGDFKVGIVTPKIFNPDGSLQRSDRIFPTPFMIFLSFCLPKVFLSPKFKNFIDRTNFKKLLGKEVSSYFWSFNSGVPVEIDQASGACLLMRKKAIKEVGVLDERIFLSSEDLDWCYRTKKAGWKIIYVPKSAITHFVSKSFKTAVEKGIYFCHKVGSKYYYVKKHYNKIDLFKVRLILLLALIEKAPRFIYYGIFKKQNKTAELRKLYQATLINLIKGKTL